jgi:type II secretory pathway component PulF
MFAFIAEQYEEQFRQSLKRAMALVEPAAIGIVAIAVGAVALGLVAAMSSVYSTVS